MDDRLELDQTVRIGEDEAAEGGAIQGAVRAAILVTETGDDCLSDRGAGRHQLARQPIGVHHGGAAIGQPAGDGRLAAADRPDQADDRRVRPETPAASAPPEFRHGAASSNSSQASSVAARASFTVASSPVTRRSSTKLP